MNTVRTVKDARRGKYKPRKKKKNKTESKEQKTALQLLRDKIELEKKLAPQCYVKYICRVSMVSV